MTYEAWRISYQSSEQAARAAYAECARLQAKIAEMEKQEPVAEIGQQYTLLFAGSGSITEVVKSHGLKIGDKLYALPGAQPAQSVPDGWKLVPITPTQEMRAAWDSSPICEDDDAEFRRAYSEMLAAAPEAKP